MRLRLYVDHQAGWPRAPECGVGTPDNAQSSLCRVRRGGPWCFTSFEAQRHCGLAPLRERWSIRLCRLPTSRPGRVMPPGQAAALVDVSWVPAAMSGLQR